MMLIADSGSTKTSWVWVGGSGMRHEFTTSGFNPYVQTKEEILLRIENEVIDNVKNKSIQNIFFYGAGCSTEENKNLMHECFKKYFSSAEIEIEHDLIAAARALWFDKPGIVAILGTGSNSCVYDGSKIIEAVPSLGYVLGDEASGAYLGKKLLADFLYGNMPKMIREKIAAEFKINAMSVLDRVYKQPNPNRYLASFAPFIRENIDNLYTHELVMGSMGDFYQAHIRHYEKHKSLPLGVVGSIGYYFEDFFRDMGAEFGFRLEKVIKSPIQELVQYHIKRNEK